MKTRSKKTNPDKELAAFWGGVTERTIRNWRREGAPLDDPKAMAEWIAARKNIAPAVLKKNSSSPPETIVSKEAEADGEIGAAAALRRLEQQELESFRRLEGAIAAGDAIKIRLCHDVWLKCGEALRKYDLMVEQSRRSTGELVPIGEMQKFFRHFIASMQIAFTLGAEGITNEICGKKELEIYKHIRGLGNQALFMSTLGYCHGCKDSPDQRLVEYAKKCIEDQFSWFPAEWRNDLEQRILQIVAWANEERGQPL